MIDWQAFHFIRPEWLWLIPFALLCVLVLLKVNARRSGWQNIVSSHLYQRLVISNDKKASTAPFYILAFSLTVAALALAGPTWQKLPQPVYQVDTGKVIVLDMSMSMRATDLQPNRLSRAKFKTIDLLNSIEDGEVGLVVYAGDAFTVSPLTSDANNITTLVPSLRPEIMPLPGSDPYFAFEEAERLLTAAGYAKGEIYWITDGIEPEDVEELRDFVSKSSYRYSVLGVGSKTGAPIKLEDGSFLKDTQGNIVLPSLRSDLIEQVLGTTVGRYTPIQSDDSDIKNMIFDPLLLDQNQVNDEVLGQGDQWQDMGIYLVLLLLPFAAYAFRRGVLVVLVAAIFIVPQEPAYANSEQTSETEVVANESESASWYSRIFKNANQKGLQFFEEKNYRKAATEFEDPMWKGSALYKNQDYEAALQEFEKVPGAESLYNQGNTLAQLGKLQEAIDKYDAALTLHAGHANAIKNKKIIEDLLKQQQEQENQSDSQEQDQGDSGESQDSQDSQSQNGENGEKSENSENSENSESSEQSGNNNASANEQQPESEGSEQSDSQNAENSGQREEAESQQQEVSKNTEADEQDAPNRNDEQQSSAQDPQQSPDKEQTDETKEQLSAVQKLAEEDMTPEQREQAQRMQMLMNKVPDDPAFLLKQKMLLESQKRRRERISRPNKKDW
ncbi:VWA domain-containing protein [Glaciecola sp. MH2013]|uniref:vWA domain-containing protein n=1 Tax=Glaciecola sp. MH2013 TaxID=2785524 RepID=UPI00189E7530|nr:VWA domain-containing protein [Glaciecola sp. MH2013]MBF7073270.1 VWA domain-containing protein [Glaciecola sp. MH2013]